MCQTSAVVIAERECLFRRGLAACLEADRRFEIVASVGTAREAYDAAARNVPALMIVGTTLPDQPGHAPVAELRLRQPAVAIIVMVDQLGLDDLVAAGSAGAVACIGKDVSEEQLLRTVSRVAAGELPINEQLLERSAVKRAGPPSRTLLGTETWRLGGAGPLTCRELQILTTISDGMTNVEIGVTLGISVQTVKNHVTTILRKLGVNDRTQAAVLPMRRGWLSIEDTAPDTVTPPLAADAWSRLPGR